MADNKKYLATVLVPAYNHEKYVLESLEGLANQTFKDFQIIVTDDHSSDKTPQILKENQTKYGYELILNDRNVGISSSLTNMAKNYAEGKYIFICASDDVYMPDRIEKQVHFMEDHPQFGMCYARAISIDTESNVLGKDTFKGYKSGHIFEDIYLRRYNPGICVAMRADVLKEIGYYESGMLAEDYYMNCRIAEKYPIGFIDDYLLKYRVAPLAKKRDPWKLIESHRQTVDFFSYRPEYKKAVKKWKLRSGALIAPYTKYKYKALKFLLSSISFDEKSSRESVYAIIRRLIFRWWKIDK